MGKRGLVGLVVRLGALIGLRCRDKIKRSCPLLQIHPSISISFPLHTYLHGPREVDAGVEEDVQARGARAEERAPPPVVVLVAELALLGCGLCVCFVLLFVYLFNS